MNNIPYAYVMGILMYAQVCIGPDVAFFVGILRKYQSNSGIGHYKVVKKVLRYLQETKDYMFMHR